MNLQQMMKQAQEMQKKMQEAQEELKEKEYTGQAGGGVVSVTVNGQGDIEELNIEPDCVDPDDVEMLEDLVLSAIEAAQEKAEEAKEETMGDMGMPMDQLGNLGNM
ncbi:MAG: YbaB/EbfC family nucleoid-associated protein, partial [bacterium]